MPNRHSDVFIILNSADQCLLINNTLPEVAQDFHFWQSCQLANQALHDTYGISALTLAPFKTEWETDQSRFTYLMLYQGGELPRGGAWVHPAELTLDVQEAVLWLKHPSPLRVPWYSADFFASLRQSLESTLGTEFKLEQIRSWGRSSIWRVQTTTQTFYYKAVPPMFAHEVALSARLAERFPHQVASVRGQQRGAWLLMDAYQGTSLVEAPSMTLELWERALVEYARWQQKFTVNCPEFIQQDQLPLRDIAWMQTHFRALLADQNAQKRGDFGLSDAECAQLQEALPRLSTALEQLHVYAQHCTLVHGDFWAGQVIHTADDRLLFTDWSDSAYSFPFFDVVFFLAEIANDFPHEPDAKERLKEAYLRKWASVFDPPTRTRLYQACEALAPLYTALRYDRDILPAMERGWEMENMLTYQLRLVLKGLETTSP